MTWSTASFLLLALALLAGFAAYERTKPTAKVLALVATLAALAALGRVAFAPLPNVKPTTDVVIVAGAALGPAAGFAVGAVAAVSSNLVFGQGPWTPWQMGGWALCGLLGAGLAWAYRRRRPDAQPGRWALAGVGVAGALVFGALVDFGTAVTVGGRDLVPRFEAMYLGTSLPWNLVHAGANVVFALAFGPVLLRAVTRFRERFTVTWRALPVTTLLALLLLPAAVALAASPGSYLHGAQNADGGWGASPGQKSASLYTAWGALGQAARGVNPLDQVRGGHTPLDVLRGSVKSIEDPGEIERTMLVLGAAGVSPRNFGGRNLRALLLSRQRKDGSVGGQIAWTAFGVLALRATGTAAGAGSVKRMVAFLARHQEKRGGWGFYRRGAGADVDDTGGVLQALATAGRGRSGTAKKGVAWLVRQQGRSGGFAAQPGGFANAQSTAFAVGGLLAAGRNPERTRKRGGHSAMTYLRARVRANGAVAYSASSRQTPVWVTGQATVALRKRRLPIRAVPRRSASGSGAGGGAGSTPAAAAATGGASAAAGGGGTTATPSSGGSSSAATAAARKTDTVSTAVGTPTSLLLARSAGALTALALAPFSVGGR
jgi:energy-coupling factor transport system substrate-specific component